MTVSLEGMGGMNPGELSASAPDTCAAAKSPLLALYDASTALNQEFSPPNTLWGIVVQGAKRLMGHEGITAAGALREYVVNAERASGMMQGLATRLTDDKRRLHDFSRKNIEIYGQLVAGLQNLDRQAESLELRYRAIAESLTSLPHSSPEHGQYWLAEHGLREKLQDSASDRVLQASRIPRMDSMIAIAADVEKTMGLAIIYVRLAVQHTSDNIVLVNEIAPSINDYLLSGKAGCHLAGRVAELHKTTKLVVGAFGKTARAMAHVYQEATGASPAAKDLRGILQTSYQDAERLTTIATDTVLASCASELSKQGLSYDFVKTKEHAA